MTERSPSLALYMSSFQQLCATISLYLLKEPTMNNKNYKWLITPFLAMNILLYPYSVTAANADYSHGHPGHEGVGMHEHQRRGMEYGHPSQQGGSEYLGHGETQHEHLGPQRGNVHGHGESVQTRGHYYHNGNYYNYHHNGSYYNYYHGGDYYRYLINGAYYNFFYRGTYYQYFIDGQYYNYFYNGAYYNDCRKVPGYRAQGVWHPAVMVCH